MPTAAVTKKNFYKDSVALMRISQTMGGREGLVRVSLLMGTPANKDILGQTGLLVAELAGAAPADLMILVEGGQDALAPALVAIEAALAGGDATPSADTVEIAPRSIAMGQERLAGATLAQVSVPGPYAAAEALKALKRGLHVFLFSDNVPLAEEQAVKRLAAKKGLLVMGPDCGTAIIAGVPLGFANAVRRGAVGVVGASGTGMQEVTCRIHQLGEGVSHAIGTGSRDVYEEIGGTTLLAGLELLARDPATGVIVIVSNRRRRGGVPSARWRRAQVEQTRGRPVPRRGPKWRQRHRSRRSNRRLHRGRARRERNPRRRQAIARGPAVARQRRRQKFCAKLCWAARIAPKRSSSARCRRRGVVGAPLGKRWRAAERGEPRGVDLGADEFTVGRRSDDRPAAQLNALRRRRATCVAAIVLDVVLGYGRTRIQPLPAVRGPRGAAGAGASQRLPLRHRGGPAAASCRTAQLPRHGAHPTPLGRRRHSPRVATR